MIRAAPRRSEMQPVPVRISDSVATRPEMERRHTAESPSDPQDPDCRSSLWTGNEEVNSRPKRQDWTSTQVRETFENPPAAEGVHHVKGPYTRVEYQEKTSAERPSLVEMKTYALSRIHHGPLAQQTHRPVCDPLYQDSRCFNRPRLRRCRSWLDTQSTCHTSALQKQPQSRRWSMCKPDGGGLHCAAGETGTWTCILDAPTAERWCEEFHETRVADWQQTVTDFGQAWKRWCFAQRQARFWQDNLVKESITHFWQPLSDFNYVLSVYSFLEGVKNRSLLPHLRRTYMTWRSLEQITLHKGFDLGHEEAGPFDANTSSDGASRDDDSRIPASKYPLTIHQHLRVARICGDIGMKLKNLEQCLEEFRNRREACAMASNETGLFSPVMAERRWHLTDAAKEFSGLMKTLAEQLRDSRNRLCEALGLDPKKVPGGGNASVPTMTAMKYEKASDDPSPCHDGLELPRSFWVKKASLQASRIALETNLYITLMPREISQRLSRRLMTKSTEMATMAKEAGDYKAEAALQRLHNKSRKLYERTGQEFPEMKPKMTLLDSETWAVLSNPRKDMQVEVHGHIATPVETLIDMPLTPQTPESINVSEGRRLSATDNLPSVNSTTTTTEHSHAQGPSGDYQPLTTSSSTVAVPEPETDKD